MNQSDIYNAFLVYFDKQRFRNVERSNLISPFFKGEFNLSGAHGYLVPTIQMDKKHNIDSISVVDQCIRQVDSEIIGISPFHLLLFEMAVFGRFGYIANKEFEEKNILSHLIKFLDEIGIPNNKLIFTICDGIEFKNGNSINYDQTTFEVLRELNISTNSIIKTKGRRNFMLSRGIDRLAGYNIEVFVNKNNKWLEIASINIYEYLNKLNFLKPTINKGIGGGFGLERLALTLSTKNNVFELPPFSNIIKRISCTKNLINGHILVEEKIFRIIELSKTLLFIINDGHSFDNSPQGKIMKRYLAKIISESLFLQFNLSDFMRIFKDEIIEFYNARFSVKESSFEILHNYINDGIERKKY